MKKCVPALASFAAVILLASAPARGIIDCHFVEYESWICEPGTDGEICTLDIFVVQHCVYIPDPPPPPPDPPEEPPGPPETQCADGVDNDGDGAIDLADAGCDDELDNDETGPAPPNPFDEDDDEVMDCLRSLVDSDLVTQLPLPASRNLGQNWGGPADNNRPGHRGVDVRAATGDDVRAGQGGVVGTIVRGQVNVNQPGYDPAQPMGNHIRIDNDDGSEAFYAHLQHPDVDLEIGDRVELGQVIGTANNTGNSFGSHLHYVLRTGANEYEDPEERHGECDE